VTRCLSTWSCWCFSWENVFRPPQKQWLCTEKKTERTSSATFGFGKAAKCCELKHCADRVRSRTYNKDEVLESKFRNLNFLPSTKKTTEYSFELFLSIYRYLVFFLKFLTSLLSMWIVLQNKLSFNKKPPFQKRRWSYARFPAKKTSVAQKHRAISRQEKMAYPIPHRVVLGLPSHL